MANGNVIFSQPLVMPSRTTRLLGVASDLLGNYQQKKDAENQALADIGYKGTATLELNSGDLDYLKETSRRFDLILTGA